MPFSVTAWWALLCAVGALNVLVWALSALALRRRQAALPAEVFAMRRAQVLLSAGYVFGCAFRCALPVYDVPRLCLVDSWLSSVLVGRSVATLAELCFVGQWALMLREAARAAGSAAGQAVSRLLLPMIVVAEVCSWYSVLTTSNIGHVIEEALWGLSAALVAISLVKIWPRCPRSVQPLLAAWGFAGGAYVIFMFGVNVPMYWWRWLADEASGRSYLSLSQGLLDISSRWVVSHRWDDWQNEVAWMSAYFSLAVWLSIALIHMPAPAPAPKAVAA